MAISIAADGQYLSLKLPSGESRFHAVWLHDNSLHPQIRSPENGQRLITLAEQAPDLRIESAIQQADDLLQVRFAGQSIAHDFPLFWLEANRYDRVAAVKPGWTDQAIKRWGCDLQDQIPTGDFVSISHNKAALKDWLAAVRCYGFAVLDNLPDDPEALLWVVDLFGHVRATNYGRFFEVRSEINPVNLAYTGLGLQAHTDNPYRDPVPTLQLLSCIENTTEGGESIVVDGFQAAAQLQQENPAHFELLASYCARFQYTGTGGVCLNSKRPMLELNADGELIAVRFNNRSAAPFTDIPFEVMADYYRAYRHFAENIERSDNAVRFRLQPGQLFIVDNLRVMHSRTAFSGGGTRWLRGCYADKDGLLSTLSGLEAEDNSQ